MKILRDLLGLIPAAVKWALDYFSRDQRDKRALKKIYSEVIDDEKRIDAALAAGGKDLADLSAEYARRAGNIVPPQ